MGEKFAKADIHELVLDHHREMYAYAYRLCGSSADAEDLVQTVFLTAQEKIEQLRSREKARAWLYAILRSHFYKLCRKRQPLSAATLEMELDELAAPVGDPAEIDREKLQNALDALPQAQRLALVMFYFEECSYREMAEQLDVAPGTVMSRLARAKARLRDLLSGERQTLGFPDQPADTQR